MQQLLPILTFPRLSIHTPSPSYVCSPILSFNGYFTFPRDLMTTPWPILAPNKRKSPLLHALPGKKDMSKKELQTCHKSLNNPFLPGWYQVVKKSVLGLALHAANLGLVCQSANLIFYRVVCEPSHEGCGCYSTAHRPGPTCNRKVKSTLAEES